VGRMCRGGPHAPCRHGRGGAVTTGRTRRAGMGVERRRRLVRIRGAVWVWRGSDEGTRVTSLGGRVGDGRRRLPGRRRSAERLGGPHAPRQRWRGVMPGCRVAPGLLQERRLWPVGARDGRSERRKGESPGVGASGRLRGE
jgi:hypothetical protein